MAEKINRADTSKDGTFKLKYSMGFATLKVTPPQTGGKPVYVDQVLNRMKMLKIPLVRKKTIQDIIERGRGEPEQLVEWPDGVWLSAILKVTVNSEKMTAMGIMSPPKKGGGTLSYEDVITALKDSGVIFGIDERSVERMIGDRIYGKEVVLARGRKPLPGRKARVRHLFKVQPKPYLTMDFGRINLRELNFVQNKKAGDIVAVLEPPEPPVDGINVCGEKLPSQSTGSDEVLKAGVNAKMNKEKDKIISLIDGNVFIKNGAVHVERVVSVEGVNYKTGNIDFDGSVVVNGTIADGFTVKAKGSVQVARFVGKVAVEAGRDIVLRGGMNGNREGSLLCEGDLFSRYLESTSINCKGNLIVEEAIMHSNLTVGGNTLLTGKRAELLAGTSIIGGSLWCKKLGNVAEARTSVALGIEPENLSAYMKMQGMIEEKIEELDRLDSELRGIDSAVQAGKIPLDRAFEERKELEDRVYRLNADIGGLRSESRVLRKRMTPSVQSMLIVEQTMYHGVVINFGREEFRVPLKGLQRTIFRLNKRGKIAESGFNPLDRPRVKFKYTRGETG